MMAGGRRRDASYGVARLRTALLGEAQVGAGQSVDARLCTPREMLAWFVPQANPIAAEEHMPARIVIHKSSQFRESERTGFLRALDEKGIRSKDFVAITDTDIRLFGDKDYPPKRGTLLTISETEGVLYTRGTVDFYKTYPGMYVPNPLKITVYEQDSSLESLCDEILGLTKMNWNNTQMDGRLPITLECARKIGDIMKYVSPTGSRRSATASTCSDAPSPGRRSVRPTSST